MSLQVLPLLLQAAVVLQVVLQELLPKVLAMEPQWLSKRVLLGLEALFAS